MVDFQSKYVAKEPDAKGYIQYSSEENAVWRKLYERQLPNVQIYACKEYLRGIHTLRLSASQIPQLPEVTHHLNQATGWSVVPVKALITPDAFFTLLAKRQFPAATFIRTKDEIDYVKEPDIFHELFGHCPMLTEPVFADFVQHYATMVLQIDQRDWPLLQRLFWFTVEFGLIKSEYNYLAYGGGILSSFTETKYCIESTIPQRKPFDPLDALRTPYRIDRLQNNYFVLDRFQDLFHLVDNIKALKKLLKQAHQLGEYPPSFPVEEGNPCIHVNAC